MQLCQKQKYFPQPFAALLRTTSNFQHVQKKMTLIADVFSKLETAKNVVKKMPRKSRFKPPFDSQHAKGYQTLLKRAAKHFYQIFKSL